MLLKACGESIFNSPSKVNGYCVQADHPYFYLKSVVTC